jgi:hypothetical protein
MLDRDDAHELTAEEGLSGESEAIIAAVRAGYPLDVLDASNTPAPGGGSDWWRSEPGGFSGVDSNVARVVAAVILDPAVPDKRNALARAQRPIALADDV